MKRKLVQQGTSTLMVSLPSKWIKENKLEKGSEVDLDVEGENIFISKGIIKVKKEVSITIDGNNRKDIFNILTHIYRKGFTKIIVRNSDEKLNSKISDITKDFLLGFELTSKTKNSVTIENISEPNEEKYDVMLKRSFFIIKEMQNSILDGVEKDYYDVDIVNDLRDQLDRLLLFLRR